MDEMNATAANNATLRAEIARLTAELAAAGSLWPELVSLFERIDNISLNENVGLPAEFYAMFDRLRVLAKGGGE